LRRTSFKTSAASASVVICTSYASKSDELEIIVALKVHFYK
jgi:hypothetical protein